MSIVLLSSGGLDSTLSAILAVEQNIEIHPLFVDYGQRAKDQELNACQKLFKKFDLPEPRVVSVQGFGKLFPSGLTNKNYDIYKDAFLPGRNMLFLLLGATYACHVGANSISIGLLDENLSLFPDQTKKFILEAENLICTITGRELKILTPLIHFSKMDVVELANKKGIIGTYSCHAGGLRPCGKCISCREYNLK